MTAKRITFDRSLYLPAAVEAAAVAYANHATIALTSGSDALVAEISAVVGDDAEIVVHAFCNHVLHETIGRMRSAAPPEIG